MRRYELEQLHAALLETMTAAQTAADYVKGSQVYEARIKDYVRDVERWLIHSKNWLK